jgi:hypothetical protein
MQTVNPQPKRADKLEYRANDVNAKNGLFFHASSLLEFNSLASSASSLPISLPSIESS